MTQNPERSLMLFHGSPVRVETPLFGKGNSRNDYGLGFYCTESKELACEWACPTTENGYVNSYGLQTTGLAFLNLNDPSYTCLHWLAALVKYRRFDATTPLMAEAKEFVLERYSVDLSKFDVVSGYRADDSYFSFARAFLDNRLSLSQLQQALLLGELGKQVVIRSKRAFDALSFIDAELVRGSDWHPRRSARDNQARAQYRNLARDTSESSVYMLDLLRGA